MENNASHNKKNPDFHQQLSATDFHDPLAREIQQQGAVAEDQQQSSEREVLKRKWGWIGHTLRKPCYNITKYSLKWNSQGKRKWGRPRNTWHRDLDADIKRTGYSWTQLEKIAQDRVRWKAVRHD